MRKFYILKLLIICALSFFSCIKKLTANTSLTLVGENNVEVFLYVSEKNALTKSEHLKSIAKLATGETKQLSPGKYILINECSKYEITLQNGDDKKIFLQKINLEIKGEFNSKNDIIVSYCFDPVDKQKYSFDEKTSFNFLPGENNFYLGGVKMDLKLSNENNPPTQIKLAHLLVRNLEKPADTKYYFKKLNENKSLDEEVLTASIGKKLWLVPGTYLLEINGTKREATVEKDVETEVYIGSLRIQIPATFSVDERRQKGGQPVYVYINEGVLFNLNTDYLIFPGEYKVSIEGSELQKIVLVEPNKSTVVNTFAAQINTPPCLDASKNCKIPPKITIHSEQKPYALMYVQPNTPFLVFDEKYEYGVDGTRGILKTLAVSNSKMFQETLARIKFTWELRSSPNKTRTDLVRLEGKLTNTYGKSLDFLFSRPGEIYAPPGNWNLSYFVGDPSTERSKTKLDIVLNESETKEIIVPIFYDKTAIKKDDEQANTEENETKNSGTLNSLPTSLNPLKK